MRVNRAMQMADEFPDVEVTGCDLAPIQPECVSPFPMVFILLLVLTLDLSLLSRFVPPNCE